MSEKKFIRCLAIPIAMIVIGCYLLGIRIYQNHTEPIMVPAYTMAPEAGEAADVAADEPAAVTDTADAPEPEEPAANDKININTASKQELTRLYGIGETLAGRIVEKREEMGGFSVPEQLLEVKGIGEKLFRIIEDDITT